MGKRMVPLVLVLSFLVNASANGQSKTNRVSESVGSVNPEIGLVRGQVDFLLRSQKFVLESSSTHAKQILDLQIQLGKAEFRLRALEQRLADVEKEVRAARYQSPTP